MKRTLNRQPMEFNTRRVMSRGDESIVTVFNPKECSDFDWITGKVVSVNERKYKVRKVERTTKLPTCRRGEDIQLIGRYI